MQIHRVTLVTQLDPGGEPILDRLVAATFQLFPQCREMVFVEEDVDITMPARLRTVKGVHCPPSINLVNNRPLTEPPSDGQDLFSVHPRVGIHAGEHARTRRSQCGNSGRSHTDGLRRCRAHPSVPVCRKRIRLRRRVLSSLGRATDLNRCCPGSVGSLRAVRPIAENGALLTNPWVIVRAATGDTPFPV